MFAVRFDVEDVFFAVDDAGAFLAVVDFAALLVAVLREDGAFAVVLLAEVDRLGVFFAVDVDLAAVERVVAFFAVVEPDLLAVVRLDAVLLAVVALAAVLFVAVALASLLSPETNAFSSAPALNFGTAVFLARLRSPVRGLRTMRDGRITFSKAPKPVIATFSPLTSSRVTTSRTDSRACPAAFLFPS